MSRLSVSFIVPCYCTEKRLLMRCMRSVLALGGDIDLEILLIDDGTPQTQVGSWVKELGDSRIHYHYQENAGLGGARNAGIAYASKDYVQFVDSDDYLFVNQYRRCLELLDRYSPDLLKFGMKKVYSVGMEPDAASKGGFSLYASGAEYMQKNSLFAAACSYLVKREIIAGKRFVTGILHEDEEFTPRLLVDCGMTLVARIAPYAYYQREDSIIGNRGIANLERRFSDLLKVQMSLKSSMESAVTGRREALVRRIDQLCEAFVYDVIRLSPDRAFFDRWIGALESNGMYPIPFRRYNWKYVLFYALTCKRWMVKMLYCVNKRLKLL